MSAKLLSHLSQTIYSSAESKATGPGLGQRRHLEPDPGFFRDSFDLVHPDSQSWLLSVVRLCFRTETVVEKMLTNWMSICLYSFLKVNVCLKYVIRFGSCGLH